MPAANGVSISSALFPARTSLVSFAQIENGKLSGAILLFDRSMSYLTGCFGSLMSSLMRDSVGTFAIPAISDT